MPAFTLTVASEAPLAPASLAMGADDVVHPYLEALDAHRLRPAAIVEIPAIHCIQ
ncbi:hypothetical protein ACJQWK_04600 [Exserohilum turcicum]